MDKQKLLELMKEYNKLIVRFNKANNWMENNIATVDTQIENYRALIKDIEALGKDIKQLGYGMNGHETLEGFDQIKALDGAI